MPSKSPPLPRVVIHIMDARWHWCFRRKEFVSVVLRSCEPNINCTLSYIIINCVGYSEKNNKSPKAWRQPLNLSEIYGLNLNEEHLMHQNCSIYWKSFGESWTLCFDGFFFFRHQHHHGLHHLPRISCARWWRPGGGGWGVVEAERIEGGRGVGGRCRAALYGCGWVLC